MRLIGTLAVTSLLLLGTCAPNPGAAPTSTDSPSSPAPTQSATQTTEPTQPSEPAPAGATLESTTWVLTGIAQGDAIKPVVGMKEVTLVIESGSLTARACNSIAGEVSITGDQVEVGPLVATEMACESEEEMLQEGEFMGALETASSYTIDGAKLTLATAEGALLFEAKAGA
ncbi:META domain-containing protein [Tessaracoccus caeni]|uniref:META domain-containing protein n=1 Tax=Tessaracoccus caeni TaxID=3031239 RepID=UPI0023DC5561|nr:META domain-containing protein [Tessaracoccus caeni]MDF1486904.1 META domain-containing protein [Tessaracoccus caeni]